MPPSLFQGVDRGNQADVNQLFLIAGNAVRLLLWLGGAAAVIVLVLAGIMYITSSGDPQRLTKAKSTIINSVIGLILMIFAYAIVSVIVGKLR